MKKLKVIISTFAIGMVVLFSCQKDDVVDIATKNTQNEIKKYGCSCSASNAWGYCTVSCVGDPCMANCSSNSWYLFTLPVCSCSGSGTTTKIIVKDENVVIMDGLITILKSHKDNNYVDGSISKIKKVQAFNKLNIDDYSSN